MHDDADDAISRRQGREGGNGSLFVGRCIAVASLASSLIHLGEQLALPSGCSKVGR